MTTQIDTRQAADKEAAHYILIINSGSSTIKYQLLNMDTETLLLKGKLDGIGLAQGKHYYFWIDKAGQKHQNSLGLSFPDYPESLADIARVLIETESPEPSAIGHRVVHGGNCFSRPTLIEQDVLSKIEQLSSLAPLHNPANVLGIRVCLRLFPDAPQVAVFDTAFHQTMPDYAYRYAIPDSWYEKYQIRRYGFHGSSHLYVAGTGANFLQKPVTALNLITLHLGNGASIAAIKKGLCIDTSMGFTPLEGLIMGTRSGDIDPSIPLYMQQETNMSTAEISDQLNHHSGLVGLTGNQDMRELLKRSAAGDLASKLALKMYCYRIKKYIGAYAAALGQVDAIIFTGGIGENAATIRSLCCANLNILGIEIDEQLNNLAVDQVAAINPDDHKVKVLVVRTNEELQIAQDVLALINS